VGLLEGFVHYRRGAGGLFSHSATPLLQSLLDTTCCKCALKEPFALSLQFGLALGDLISRLVLVSRCILLDDFCD